MSAITIRNLPEHVHDRLRLIAKREGRSVEAVARAALEEVARKAGGGIDFDRLAAIRAEMGLADIGEAWIDAFDDPAFSRQVLGLEP
jgi:plasmid stability protein